MNLEKIDVHKFKRRFGERHQHHLTPKSRGGSNISSNLLLLDKYRHVAWHYLFKNMTLNEIILFLIQIDSIKKLKYRGVYVTRAKRLLFGKMTLSEIIFCLKRLNALKSYEQIKYRL